MALLYFPLSDSAYQFGEIGWHGHVLMAVVFSDIAQRHGHEYMRPSGN